MTEQEIKDYYKSWVKDYCNDNFEDDDGNEDLPAGVELFLDKIVEYHGKRADLKSKSIEDLSESYATDIPARLLKLIQPYRRLSW